MKNSITILFITLFLSSCEIMLETKIDVEQPDNCNNIDKITDKVYLTYVIHNEEDDANCIKSSARGIPDYNDDQETFTYYSNQMFLYAEMLKSHGATLSYQPDWTFTEGVKKFDPTYFKRLIALGNVEILPHAHET